MLQGRRSATTWGQTDENHKEKQRPWAGADFSLLGGDLDAPAAANPDSEEQSSLGELSACVAPMIAALPEKYRDALIMTDLNGMTQQEAANRLGVSLSGAKSRVQRGRKQIKDMLLACCRVELDRLGGVVDFAPRGNGSCRHCGDGCKGACRDE